MRNTVLLTDYAWPDDSIERGIVESAGFQLVSGPSSPAPAAVIEQMVREHRPAAILTCWARVSATAIAEAPDLKIVARLGVGLDNIDVEAATANGVWVTNVPDYCVEEVSDHAVGFVLAWTRGLVGFGRQVRAGEWNPAGARLRRLATLTCGIIGFGRIGRATARKLGGFGCRLLAHDPHAGAAADVQLVELDSLMRQSDIVIVHAPLTESTRHLIDHARLALMKPGGLLINVSRGAVVDTVAIVDALRTGQLSAAGLDVLEFEPDVPEELRLHPGAMLTPHVAFSSDTSLVELRQRAAQEVVRVLRGLAPEQARNVPKARKASP